MCNILYEWINNNVIVPSWHKNKETEHVIAMEGKTDEHNNMPMGAHMVGNFFLVLKKEKMITFGRGK